MRAFLRLQGQLLRNSYTVMCKNRARKNSFLWSLSSTPRSLKAESWKLGNARQVAIVPRQSPGTPLSSPILEFPFAFSPLHRFFLADYFSQCSILEWSALILKGAALSARDGRAVQRSHGSVSTAYP